VRAAPGDQLAERVDALARQAPGDERAEPQPDAV
jgi:hypothetical protein